MERRTAAVDPPVFSEGASNLQKLKPSDEEVGEELRLGLIVVMERGEMRWEHPMFQIPKKSGKWRMIVDCSLFNQLLQKHKFKRKNHYYLLQQLLRKGW